MRDIGIYQSLRNSALFEHRCLQNINKLYKHTGKSDKQQQLKDILEAAMVSNPELFTNNSPIYPKTPTRVKKTSSRKSLCIFTNILYMKNKNYVRLVGAAKSERKSIKAGTVP